MSLACRIGRQVIVFGEYDHPDVGGNRRDLEFREFPQHPEFHLLIVVGVAEIRDSLARSRPADQLILRTKLSSSHGRARLVASCSHPTDRSSSLLEAS